MMTVTISDKGGQQSKLEFRKYEISIGRMKGNDIVLAKGNVSKRHASIYLRGDTFFINDHGSTNGTYINGRKVEGENQLAGDDKLYIGDFILQLESGISDRASGPPNLPPMGRSNERPFDDSRTFGQDGANRPGHDTLYDPMAGDPDPLRQTFTSPPEHNFGSPGNDPAGIRDTIGAHDDLQPVGKSGGLYDSSTQHTGNNSAVRPTPSTTKPPAAPPERHTGANAALDMKTPLPAASRPDPARPDPPPKRPTEQATPYTPRPIAAQHAPAASRAVSSLNIQPPQVIAEFDAEFFATQVDIARVLLEQLPIKDLPLDYPPQEADRERIEGVVDGAISAINPARNRDKFKRLLMAECLELGALEMYLADERVRDIYVNHYDQILLRRDGVLIQAEHTFSSPEFLELAARRLLGERPDVLGVGADEIRLGDGTRVHILMPPLSTSGPLITARKPPSRQPGLEDLVEQGVLSISMADFLMRAIDAGRSIAVAGPTSSGKTSVLAALGSLIHEGMRIICVEDYNHIKLPQGSAVHLEATPTSGYDKRFLLRNALSMHPQRILLDECRGAEAYDWVTSVASGTEGSMLTIHGTSASDALGRMESLCLLGSHEISPRGLREQIARAINLVLVVNRIGDAGFRIQQITEVQGVDLDTFRLNDIFYYRTEGAEGSFHPTGYIPLFFEDLQNAGVQVDFDIFQE